VINAKGLYKHTHALTIDSVVLDGYKLIKVHDTGSNYIINENQVSIDTVVIPIAFFINNREYISTIDKDFFRDCMITFKCSLYYYKGKACMELRNCTTRGSVGFLKIKKLNIR